MIGSSLPIWTIAERFTETIRDGGRRIVISAPTGSGKSTQVPHMLVDRAGVAGQIVMLEPRRIAARMLAKRVAQERQSQLGREVGYQIRFDDCSSVATRIKFVTEAIIFRRLISNPRLDGIDAVVFDEFHERHLYTDITLGRILALQAAERPDLLMVAMSATLDADRLKDYLAPCAVLRAEGRTWPVAVTYLDRPADPRRIPVWDLAAAAAADYIENDGGQGDILVFMPGAYEIGRTLKALRERPQTRDCALLPLHGELAPGEQDRALEPAARRRIVVSTNVAETSLTIDGVTLVIDSGLARIARYDHARGINTLLVEKISRAAADQRTGRAGRTAPGHCRRLWTQREQAERPPHETPEVCRVDLSEALLLLAASGIPDVRAFNWPDPPEPASIDRALLLLADLGAYDPEIKAITDMGRRMTTFPVHPRYARMLIEAGVHGAVREAALIAALTQERNLLLRRPDAATREHRERRFGDETDSDLLLLMRAWEAARDTGFDFDACDRLGIHAGAARQADKANTYFLRLAESAGLHVNNLPASVEAVQRCVLLGFADHVARCIDPGTMRYAMVHGRTATLARDSVVRGASLVVAAEVQEIGRHMAGSTVQLNLATAIRDEWLAVYFPKDVTTFATTVFDPDAGRVVLRRERRFRDLVLESRLGGEPSPDDAATLLAEEIVRERIKLKHWDHAVDQLLARLTLVRTNCPELNLALFDDDGRRLFLTDLCHGHVGARELRDVQVLPALRNWLGQKTLQALDRFAPERITLDNGRSAKVTYGGEGAPFIALRIQELFGVTRLPPVAQGRVPLVVRILAPNQRPVQVTNDLRGFWSAHYPRIKRELQRKYPKHEWR